MYLQENGEYILNGSHNLVCLREGRGGPQKTTSLPNLLLETVRCSGPQLAQCSPVHLPPDFPVSSSHPTGQGSQMLSPPGGPTLEESDVVLQVDSVAFGSPLTNTIEEGCKQRA